MCAEQPDKGLIHSLVFCLSQYQISRMQNYSQDHRVKHKTKVHPRQTLKFKYFQLNFCRFVQWFIFTILHLVNCVIVLYQITKFEHLLLYKASKFPQRALPLTPLEESASPPPVQSISSLPSIPTHPPHTI